MDDLETFEKKLNLYLPYDSYGDQKLQNSIESKRKLSYFCRFHLFLQFIFALFRINTNLNLFIENHFF